MKVKERFQQLSSGQKKSVVWLLVVAVLIVFAVSGYKSSRSKITDDLFAHHKTREIQIEPDLIQKTILREQRRQLESLRKEIDKIKRDQNKPAIAVQSETKESVHQKTGKFPSIPSPAEVERKSVSSPPPPAAIAAASSRPGLKEPHFIGDITVLANSEPPSTGAPAKDKKKARTVYLPPSFMEARLLTGFDASTSGNGKNNPEPLLLRVQAPAVLPNDIKANLSGCFIIAEAVGRLDKERADVRLVSLSCLTSAGKAIIDSPVKGFVIDSDSKVGLSGRVVSRMGAAAARSIVAGFFGGLGDMLKTSATTQSTTALRTTSTAAPSQIAKYSIGGGLAEGSQSLRDFYLGLAKQSTPVIEVAATKKITVVISEGKELKIKEIKGDKI